MNETVARLPTAGHDSATPMTPAELSDHAVHAIELVTREILRPLARIRAQLDEVDQAVVSTGGQAIDAIKNHMRIARAADDAGELIAMRIAELRAMLERRG